MILSFTQSEFLSFDFSIYQSDKKALVCTNHKVIDAKRVYDFSSK